MIGQPGRERDFRGRSERTDQCGVQRDCLAGTQPSSKFGGRRLPILRTLTPSQGLGP